MCCVFSSIAAPRRDATHAHARVRPERPLHTEARELEKRGGPSTALRRRGRQAEKVLVRSAGRLNKNAAFVTSLAGGRFWFCRRPEATSHAFPGCFASSCFSVRLCAACTSSSAPQRRENSRRPACFSPPGRCRACRYVAIVCRQILHGRLHNTTQRYNTALPDVCCLYTDVLMLCYLHILMNANAALQTLKKTDAQ